MSPRSVRARVHVAAAHQPYRSRPGEAPLGRRVAPPHPPDAFASSLELPFSSSFGYPRLIHPPLVSPSHPPSAAEALLGSYLSNDGSESYLPVTAPEPWTLEALLSAAAAARVDAVVEAQLRDGSGSAAGVGRVPAPEYLWRQRSLDFI